MFFPDIWWSWQDTRMPSTSAETGLMYCQGQQVHSLFLSFLTFPFCRRGVCHSSLHCTASYVIFFIAPCCWLFLSTFLLHLPFSSLPSDNPPILAVVFLVFCNLHVCLFVSYIFSNLSSFIPTVCPAHLLYNNFVLNLVLEWYAKCSSEHNYIYIWICLCSLVDPGVPKAILTALIPMGTQILLSASNSEFCDLLVVMRTLAAAGDGSGHVALFQAAIVWLDQWSVYHTIIRQLSVCLSVCPSVIRFARKPFARWTSNSANVLLGTRQCAVWFEFVRMSNYRIKATSWSTNDDITDAHISATIQQILTKFSAVVSYVKQRQIGKFQLICT